MDPIKKAVYAGLGVISLTKEKAEELVDELIKQEESTAKRRAVLSNRLLKEGQAQRKVLEGKVSELLQKAVTDLDLPTRMEFKTIVGRLDDLEKAIVNLKKEKRGKKG